MIMRMIVMNRVRLRWNCEPFHRLASNPALEGDFVRWLVQSSWRRNVSLRQLCFSFCKADPSGLDERMGWKTRDNRSEDRTRLAVFFEIPNDKFCERKIHTSNCRKISRAISNTDHLGCGRQQLYRFVSSGLLPVPLSCRRWS